MSKLIVFNWKMNPRKLAEAISLAKVSDRKHVVVAPPFIFIEEIQKVLKRGAIGAQDIFWQNPPSGGGAFTGEISGSELKALGAKYVIIGHSERRHKMGETDAIIARKVKTALDVGLIPILCIGETATERELKQTYEVLERQLLVDL